MLARHGRLHQATLMRISWSTWAASAAQLGISAGIKQVRAAREPGLLELLGGGIHDGEIHAATQFGIVARQRVEGLCGRVGWPVDAIVIAVVVILNAVLGYVPEARQCCAMAS
jgi:Ca2+-transporting ATPase